MFCKNCGTECDDNDEFCPKCGARLADDGTAAPQPTAPHVAPVPGGNVGLLTHRDVVVLILLSIVTCGIYNIYWFYVTANDLNNADDSEDPLMNYILALLLGIVTCGIYEIYWLYKFFKKADYVTGDDNTLLSLILSIFLTPIVGMAVTQNTINRYVA